MLPLLWKLRLLFFFPLDLPLLFFLSLFLEQIEDANFSLSHPNQYFVESQKVLGGGRDIKREMETPQRSQDNSAARGSTAAREAAPSTSQDLAEMTEDLDSFFQDAWFFLNSSFLRIEINVCLSYEGWSLWGWSVSDTKNISCISAIFSII